MVRESGHTDAPHPPDAGSSPTLPIKFPGLSEAFVSLGPRARGGKKRQFLNSLNVFYWTAYTRISQNLILKQPKVSRWLPLWMAIIK